MHISLYRKYRPTLFSEMIGQKSAVNLIANSVIRGNVSHAYLFSGPRGSGKTSLARLLAKGINCTDPSEAGEPCGKCNSCLQLSAGESLDIIEIDGASNNGVDEVRELKSHVNLSPFSSKYKVYIIDEVHMLSISAFNALLKTLEEPPGYVVFVLATTEPHKVPVTIRSRCQHIPFHRISQKEIMEYLPVICEKEGRPIEKKAAAEIARHADGALRDALSILEQAMSSSSGEGPVTVESVSSVLSGGSYSDIENFIGLVSRDELKGFSVLKDILMKGASPSRVLEYLYLLSRNLWFARRWGSGILENMELTEEEIDFVDNEQSYWDEEKLVELMKFCVDTVPLARAGMRTDVLAGMIISIVATASKSKPEAEVISRKPEFTEVFEQDRETGSAEKITSPDIENHKKDEPLSSSRESEIKNIPVVGKNVPVTEEVPERPEIIKNATVDINGEALDWSELLKILSSERINIYSALLGAGVSINGNTVILGFRDGDRSSFGIMSSPGNAYSLQQLLDSRFKMNVTLKMRYSSKEVTFPAATENIAEQEDFFQKDSSSQAELFASAPGKEESAAAEEVSPAIAVEHNDEEKDKGDSSFSNTVSQLVQMTDGELLYVVDRDPEEIDDKPDIQNED